MQARAPEQAQGSHTRDAAPKTHQRHTESDCGQVSQAQPKAALVLYTVVSH